LSALIEADLLTATFLGQPRMQMGDEIALLKVDLEGRPFRIGNNMRLHFRAPNNRYTPTNGIEVPEAADGQLRPKHQERSG